MYELLLRAKKRWDFSFGWWKYLFSM